MTGLENLKARTMLADKDGDYWYYDGTGGMYCVIENGIPGGASSRLTTEFAARWAPFTELMAADWGNALTVALDERDAAERKLVDCKKELASVYAVLTRINSDIERCVRCGIEGVSGSVALFEEIKKLLAAREIALKAPLRHAPRVDRSKPGDGITPADPAADTWYDDTPLLHSELVPGARFRDRFGDVWLCAHGNLYRVVVGGIDQHGPLTAVEPNGLVIQQYKPLIRIAPPNEQDSGLTPSGSDVTEEQQPEPQDGDLFKDNAGDTWLVRDRLYHLIAYNGKRVGPAGLVICEVEMEKYKPIIKLVPENKT